MLFLGTVVQSTLTTSFSINLYSKLLVVNSSYVPFELIKKVDLENKRIEIEEVLGLL